jgi:hypothetical protein
MICLTCIEISGRLILVKPEGWPHWTWWECACRRGGQA